MNAMKTAALSILIVTVALPLAGQPKIRTERLQFPNGTSTAALKGTLDGDQIVDYVLATDAAKAATITLKASSTSTYFNILPPGTDEAMFIGSTSGGKFEGTLPKAGDYKIRVYLMRNAARRGTRSNFSIVFRMGGPGKTA